MPHVLSVSLCSSRMTSHSVLLIYRVLNESLATPVVNMEVGKTLRKCLELRRGQNA